MFSDELFHFDFFYDSDSANWIYVNMHGEKTFNALHCQLCGKYFKKKTENHGTNKATKKMVKVRDINISGIFYQTQNFHGISWASIITTYLIKLRRSGSLVSPHCIL